MTDAYAEGYARGFRGLTWETPAPEAPERGDVAASFLHDVRGGAVALRGRTRKNASDAVDAFLAGLKDGFPGCGEKPFARALARLWARWDGCRAESSRDAGLAVGSLLRPEYEEGIAGELSAYLLDERLHLRNARDYLRMRGWLRGTVERLRRKPDWESRRHAEVLDGNFSSIVLRALHNGNVGYAAEAVAGLPRMTAQLDRAIAGLRAAEPEAAHFLLKNKSTILTRALHAGYLDYPQRAAADLPRALEGLRRRIGALETSSPDDARDLRASVPSLVYRALTTGKFSAE